jgi:osmotically-inducible protein OsmY
MRVTARFVLLAALVAALAACAGSPKQQSTGEIIDDTTITTRIKARLFEDPVTSGFAIKVEVFKGTVQLSGFVNSERERRRAEDIAQRVPGVRAVRNDLILK